MLVLKESSVSNWAHTIKSSPRELIANRALLTTAAAFSLAGWDQGSSSVVPALKGFEDKFGLSSSINAVEIGNFVSIVYVGCGVGSAASFFINDRIGRLWALRLYMLVWIIGQMIATGSNGSLATLYGARIVSGLGIGALTVIGPLSLVEIAPAEFRGLISVWFSIVLLASLFISVFCVYGVYLHVPPSPLQYQIVWFSPCIFLVLVIGATFACWESPRWLMLVGRTEEAKSTIVALRGLPIDHPRVVREIEEMQQQVQNEQNETGIGARSSSWLGIQFILREAFTKKANIRRAQQACLSYALAQLSGANSVTSYLVPILKLIGTVNGKADQLRLTGLYSFAKFCFTIAASFVFVDALGRRGSLLLGTTIQMLSDIYVGVYLKYRLSGPVSATASQAAIGMIFTHGFGFSIGLLILPYVFCAEVWPNSLRSFGAAFTQTFHWFFYFGIVKATPYILKAMDDWGAFMFFAGWCFVSLIYVYFVVPETAGHSLDKLDQLFEGPWLMAYRTKAAALGDATEVIEDYDDSPNTRGVLSLRKDQIDSSTSQV